MKIELNEKEIRIIKNLIYEKVEYGVNITYAEKLIELNEKLSKDYSKN